MIGAAVAFSVRVNWTPPATKSVLSYEAVRTSVDSDAAANTEHANGNFFRQSIPEEIFSELSLITASYIRVRSVDRTGQKSAWAGGGVNINGTPNYWGYPAGSMINQNASGVAITGGTAELSTARSASLIVAPSAASSPRASIASYSGTETPTLTGSAATEDLDVDITNRGFTAKPDWGLIQIYDTNVLGVYDYAAGSTSTNARFVLFSRDGGNLPAGSRRIHFTLGKY
jgi:hypothetical protein